jgi:hypothetical protein
MTASAAAVGSVPPTATELDGVDMRCGPDLEYEDELVLGAIERPHASVVLVPNAEILERRIDVPAGRERLVEMPPVHAYEMDGSVETAADGVEENRPQEIRELARGHLAGRHRELAVLDRSQAADMAIDPDVVGRIGEHEPGSLLIEQGRIGFRIAGVAAQQLVIAKLPQISRTGDGLRDNLRLPIGGIIGRLLVRTVGQQIDFRGLEAGDLNVELEVEARQVLELDRQDFPIPPGIEGELVVGDDVSPFLRLAEMLDPNGRHHLQAQSARRFDAAVAGDDHVRLIDEDRVGEAEFANRGRDLMNLLLRVNSRVARKGLQQVDRALLDAEFIPPCR